MATTPSRNNRVKETIERNSKYEGDIMSNVVNMFEFKKKQCKKKNDTAGYNFAEVMKKNTEQDKKLKEERIKDNKGIISDL